jgi:hypothetical protein
MAPAALRLMPPSRPAHPPAAFKVPRVVHLIAEMPTTAGTHGAKVRTGELRELARTLAAC